MKKEALNKTILLLTIALIYIGIPVLILINVLDFNYKFHYLTGGAVVVYLIMKALGFSNSDIGITSCNIKKSIKDVLPITLILLLAAIFLYFSGNSKRFEPNETLGFYFFYLFISSPVQELLYRGVLVKILDYMKCKDKYIMLISTALYSFVHIIYKDWLTLVLTFIIGIIWYKCYIKTRNLVGVSISHAVLGIVTIVTGVIN